MAGSGRRVLCECDRVGDVAIAVTALSATCDAHQPMNLRVPNTAPTQHHLPFWQVRDRWVPKPNFDESVWHCLVAAPKLTLFISSGNVPLSLGALALTALWVAAYVDRRVLYTRQPPRWFQSKPAWSCRWRFSFHLRLGHPLLRPFFVVAGHTESTRLQHTVTPLPHCGACLAQYTVAASTALAGR